MKARTLALVLGIKAGLAAGVVQAGVIYSNLGPGDSFGTAYSAQTNASAATGSSYQIAAPFTPAATANFRSAELALAYNVGANAYSFTLMNDNGSNRPGTAIETLNLTGVGTTPGIYGVNSVLNPILAAGSKYWLTIFPTTANSVINWYNNNQSDVEAAWASSSLGSFPPPPWGGYGVNATTPAFRINDTPLHGIPEPSIAALLGLGFAGLSLVRRKKLPA